METDEKKTVEIALAILSLTAHSDGPFTRVWKAVDWEVMDLLYRRKWIANPVGKSKSIVLTDKGTAKSAEFRSKYLSRTDSNIENLTQLEHGMWHPEKRYDEQWFRDCLHPEFIEIGRSGRIYTYDDMFPVIASELQCKLPLPNFNVSFVASGVAIINYESHVTNDGEKISAHRTSTWVNEAGKWLLRQHQGTSFDPNS